MRRLKLKPTGNLTLQEIQYYNMRVSPDLSNISGRTSYYNSILNGELIKVVNNDNKFENVCKINSENVKVQGKILLEVELPIKTIEKEFEIGFTKELTSVTKRYVEYKGVYSYEYNNSFLVDGKIYLVNNDDTSLIIDTFEYIEDGKIVIDGKEYIVDFNDYFYWLRIKGDDEEISEENKPKVYESKYAIPLSGGDLINDSVTYIDIVDFDTDKWKRETKFNIWKSENDELVIEDALFGAYEHTIDYNGEIYTLSDLFDGNNNYLGYGVWVNDKAYCINSAIKEPESGEATTYIVDDYLLGSALVIDGEYYEIENTLISPKNGSELALFITKSEKISLRDGDTIIAKSNGPIKSLLDVYEPSGETPYVIYIDKRYEVKEGLYKYVTLSGVDCRLIDEGYNEEISAYTAYAFVGTDKMYFKYNDDGKAIPLNKIYYPIYEGDELKKVEYGEIREGYNVESKSGVTIGDRVYRVYEEKIERVTLSGDSVTEDESESYELTHKYVEISEDVEYSFIVTGKNGSKTYLCYPSIDEANVFDYDDAAATRKYISDLVVRNKDNFTFYVRNDVFGESEINPETYLYDAAISEKPFTTSEKLNISLYKINAYVNVKFPIVNRIANDILREDIISHEYTSAIKSNSLTSIVDMEKDVYYPTRYVVKSDEGGEHKNYDPIRCVRFNLHFRTRDLNTWKVMEDYVEDENSKTNWFVTDYEYYKEVMEEYEESPESKKNKFCLQNVSDLIGFMNFTTSEAKNRAKKIGKSFLRLSFYSTPNPKTQVLLGTSTIFMDDALLCKKVISLQKSANAGDFVETQKYASTASSTVYTTDHVTADSEYQSPFLANFPKSEDLRLSSRFNVYDKHISDTSSEGFYFYMYREYADNMRPKTIYLKVDFNHAGIGKTIPFMMPRKFDNNNAFGTPLYIHKDLETLKQGFTLMDIYKQIYIPINVIFDNKTNKYVYYLPESLRENEELKVDNDIMEFNLFEIKFKDESQEPKNESNQ